MWLSEAYETEEPTVASTGSQLHDKQLLLVSEIELSKSALKNYAEKKDTKYFWKIEDRENSQKSINPLLSEIDGARLLFEGHSKKQPKLFSNAQKNITGVPDYIFEKKDGTRFVVEEKFSVQKKNSSILSRPYDNHIAQIGVYLTELSEIGADYGYLVYWTYSLHSTGKPNVESALAFRVNATPELKEHISHLIFEVRDLKEGKLIPFKVSALNHWKCVNCISTEICIHKTGSEDNVRELNPN